MRIGVLSDCRVPTLPHTGHGLGMVAIDIADGLTQCGHDVGLYAGPGSIWDGDVILHEDETARATALDLNKRDVWLDLSHLHDLSKSHPDGAIVNWIIDLECPWKPPNCIVGNAFQQKLFPEARVVPLGVPVDEIPLGNGNRKDAVFVHKVALHKGYDIAKAFGKLADVDVVFVGENLWGADLTGCRHILNLAPDALYQFLGGAEVLLSPARMDAGGRVNLEAAACGTPVLCLDETGTMEHVAHCVSGFICRDLDEMVEAYGDLDVLSPKIAREWVKETHDLPLMVDGIEAQLTAVLDGERW